MTIVIFVGTSHTINISMNITGIKNLKKKPFGGAWSIHDVRLVEYRDQAIHQFLKEQSSLNHDTVKNDYFKTFKELTKKGTFGNPTLATPEKGEQIAQIVIDLCIQVLQDIYLK